MVLSKYWVRLYPLLETLAKGMVIKMQRSFLSKFQFVDKIFCGFFQRKLCHSTKRPTSIFAQGLFATITIFSMLTGDITLSKEWNVGLRLIQFPDPVMQAELDVAVWYPSDAKVKEEAVGMAILQVAKDADLISGTKGLILISHGFSGNFLGHQDTAQYLAKNGYVVATFTHPDLPGLKTRIPELDPLISRPRQVALIVEEVLNHPLFKASLLNKRIGFVGFSLGAYTGLISAGAKPDLSSLEEYCATGPRDFLLCSVAARHRFTSIRPQLASLPATQISGAVLLAPAYGPLFSKKSFAKVSIPMRMISAGKDEELDNRVNAQHFKNLLSDKAAHEIIAGAGHYIFMAPCSDQLKLVVPVICEDPASINRAEIHQRLNKDIAIFFDEVLSNIGETLGSDSNLN